MRFSDWLFRRLSPLGGLSRGAKRGVFRAASEARASGSSELVPVHLLRGVLSEPDAVTEAFLSDCGCDPATYRHSPPNEQDGDVQLAESTRRILRDATRLAKRGRHELVHSEHLLVALAASGDEAPEIRDLAACRNHLEERLRDLPTEAFASCPETRSQDETFYMGAEVDWPWRRSRSRHSG